MRLGWLKYWKYNVNYQRKKPINIMPERYMRNVVWSKATWPYLMVKFSMTPGCFSNSAFSSSNVILPLLSSSAASKSTWVKSSRSSSLKERELSSMQDRRTVLSSSRSIDPDPYELRYITLRILRDVYMHMYTHTSKLIKCQMYYLYIFIFKCIVFIFLISPSILIIRIYLLKLVYYNLILMNFL